MKALWNSRREHRVCVMLCLSSWLSQEKAEPGHNFTGGYRTCKLYLMTGFQREVQSASSARAGNVGHCECWLPQQPPEKNQGWVHPSASDFKHKCTSFFPSFSPPLLVFLLDLRNIRNIKSHLFALKCLLEDLSGLRLRAFLPIVQSSKCMRGKKKWRRNSNSIN